MSSRKKRKRDRRRAEATAEAPVLRGGWGKGSEIRPRDLLLIHRAVREGWETDPDIGAAIIRDVVVSAMESQEPRLINGAVRVAIDVVKAEHGGFDYLRQRLGRQ